METGVDFLQCLQVDMSLNILMCLDDPSDLIRASVVSQFWHHFVISSGLCKHLCLKMFPQLSRVSHVIVPSCGPESGKSLEWLALEREHRVYASLLKAATAFAMCDCITEAISASSTDNFPRESIRHTLYPRDRIWRRPSYWSSKGQSDPTVPETLVYKLCSDLCIITEINVQPFQAYFQSGNPIYSAQAVRFRFGHPKSPLEFESDLEQLPLQNPADDKFVWCHTTEEFPMTQKNHLQNFRLPEPLLCIGCGFLQIELLGRIQKQEMDGLFYICVSHVQVLGRSLCPAFEVNKNVDPSGSISLKYGPAAFQYSLWNSSAGATNPPMPPLSEEEIMGPRFRLGEFMLHNNELNEFDDRDDLMDE